MWHTCCVVVLSPHCYLFSTLTFLHNFCPWTLLFLGFSHIYLPISIFFFILLSTFSCVFLPSYISLEQDTLYPKILYTNSSALTFLLLILFFSMEVPATLTLLTITRVHTDFPNLCCFCCWEPEQPHKFGKLVSTVWKGHGCDGQYCSNFHKKYGRLICKTWSILFKDKVWLALQKYMMELSILSREHWTPHVYQYSIVAVLY